MMILALDCATSVRSAAVFSGAEELARLSLDVPARAFSAVALAQNVLAAANIRPAQLTKVVVGLGPGSFTGIRSSIAVAQGFQFGLNIEAQGVSSFDAIACGAQRKGLRGTIQVASDAQRNELYLARYQLTDKAVQIIEPARIAQIAELAADGGRILGPGIAKAFPGTADAFPDPADLARLAARSGAVQRAETLEPVYLRETAFVKAPAPRFGQPG